jgi:predicted RND superfamily exporter protein
LRNQDDSGPLRIEDLPQALRDRFIGRTGKYLIMVYPKEDVWVRANQKKFIEEVAKVDKNVTGTPVQLYHYTELLKTSYEEAARYSLIAITLLVFLHFRSPLTVALALLPVGIGFLWLGGLMGYFHIPLNPANIMTLPLVIGIGVTNGIRSTGKAVLVSGLTAIAGFGSLMLAQHRGIRSLGYVMSIGLATCMAAALTFLPAILTLFVPKELKTERPGADNAQSTPSREEPRSKPQV